MLQNRTADIIRNLPGVMDGGGEYGDQADVGAGFPGGPEGAYSGMPNGQQGYDGMTNGMGAHAGMDGAGVQDPHAGWGGAAGWER